MHILLLIYRKILIIKLKKVTNIKYKQRVIKTIKTK